MTISSMISSWLGFQLWPSNRKTQFESRTVATLVCVYVVIFEGVQLLWLDQLFLFRYKFLFLKFIGIYLQGPRKELEAVGLPPCKTQNWILKSPGTPNKSMLYHISFTWPSKLKYRNSRNAKKLDSNDRHAPKFLRP